MIKEPSKYVSKEYLEREIEIAINDFYLARNEDEQWEARVSISKTLEIASLYYGFEFADELDHQLDPLREEMGYPVKKTKHITQHNG